MRARLDWRLTAIVVATALMVALVVLVAERPIERGIDALARGDDTSSVDCDESGSADADQADDDQADGEQQDGEQQDGEQRDGEQQDGEQQDGEQQDAECEEQDGAGDEGGDGTGDEGGDGTGDEGGDGAGEGEDAGDAEDAGNEEEFPGRDEIGEASDEEYVDIESVESNSGLNLGGDFSGGSYSIECELSDHHNSDNHIIAPGVRNGAQHTHDYAGNTTTNFASDEETLSEGDTTCSNGDQSPLFWPVLRDLNGVGPDVGQDGGSLDGNVGSFLVPDIDITFHGHGTRPAEPMPLNMILVTGAAKASTEDGEGSNAKFSCTGFEDRVTDQYPLCPGGSGLQRIYDFPSCWNGQDLDSEDHVSHITYPDATGECDDDLVPVPALRITLTYDQPQGRSFAIDSFPEQQHDPITDHALLEYLSSERRAQEGADCINSAERCVQGAETDVSDASTDPRDEVARSVTFASAFATHGEVGTHGPGAGHGHRTEADGSVAPRSPAPAPARHRPLEVAPVALAAASTGGR